MTWRLEDGVVFEQEWDAENWLVSVVNWAALVVSALLLAPLVPLRRRARD